MFYRRTSVQIPKVKKLHILIDFRSILAEIKTAKNSEPEFLNFFKEPKNRFQGINTASLCSPAGRNNNPIPTLFLVHTDCLKFQHRNFS